MLLVTEAMMGCYVQHPNSQIQSKSIRHEGIFVVYRQFVVLMSVKCLQKVVETALGVDVQVEQVAVLVALLETVK